MSEKFPVFTPSDVADVIAPYLDRLEVTDAGSEIDFYIWNSKKRTNEIWISVDKGGVGLRVYLRDRRTEMHRVHDLYELNTALGLAAADPVADFRSLLGLKAQE